MLVVIILVIGLGFVKFLERNNLGDDRPRPVFLRVGFGFFGGGFLRVVAVENNRTVLRSDVVVLAIQRRGIVRFPEKFEQLAVGKFLRIEFDLDDLGVPGVT